MLTEAELASKLGPGVTVAQVIDPKRGQMFLVRYPCDSKMPAEEMESLGKMFEPASCVFIPSDWKGVIEEGDDEHLAMLGLQRIPT